MLPNFSAKRSMGGEETDPQELAIEAFTADTDRLHKMIERRREQAEAHEEKLQNILRALRHEGYSERQINSIFTSRMTPELAQELAAKGAKISHAAADTVPVSTRGHNLTPSDNIGVECNISPANIIEFFNDPKIMAKCLFNAHSEERIGLADIISRADRDSVKNVMIELAKLKN